MDDNKEAKMKKAAIDILRVLAENGFAAYEVEMVIENARKEFYNRPLTEEYVNSLSEDSF